LDASLCKRQRLLIDQPGGGAARRRWWRRSATGVVCLGTDAKPAKAVHVRAAEEPFQGSPLGASDRFAGRTAIARVRRCRQSLPWSNAGCRGRATTELR